MASFRNRIKVKQKMQRMLINAGTDGIMHTDLLSSCRTRVWTRDKLKEMLEDWKERGLVDSYMVKLPTSKKPVKIWRATYLIRSERL